MSQLQCRYEGLLGACGESILILEMPGVILGCSSGECEWLKPDALIGRQLDAVFPKAFVTAVVSMAVQAASRGEVIVKELELNPKHAPQLQQLGLTQTVAFRVRCLAAEDEIILALQDITELKSLRRMSSGQTQRDTLTGCFNRRAFRPVIEQSVALGLRYDAPFSLMLIDVDHMGQVNDNYSMDTGDQLLQQLATALETTKRTSDFLARYSEDEFIMLMPETPLDNAIAAGERVRKLLQQVSVQHEDQNLNFTVSVGVATMAGAEETADTLLGRAGQNLFVAQESGGNRVEADEFDQ
ncbi:GGDEF domain-containing protein [Pontibacter sp. JAM-7]|uniref:GGDEF domain-containing protein n=1 Tax=Pontibacter sp. JAM-7 TaxID=3366581 RepID=UPI003AF8DBEB